MGTAMIEIRHTQAYQGMDYPDTSLTKEKVFDHLVRRGILAINPSKALDLMEELVVDGLAVCITDVPGYHRQMNESYVFVANDERGFELARKNAYE